MIGVLEKPLFILLLISILLVLKVVLIVVRASHSVDQLAQLGRDKMPPVAIAAMPVTVAADWYSQGNLQRY